MAYKIRLSRTTTAPDLAVALFRRRYIQAPDPAMGQVPRAVAVEPAAQEASMPAAAPPAEWIRSNTNQNMGGHGMRKSGATDAQGFVPVGRQSCR